MRWLQYASIPGSFNIHVKDFLMKYLWTVQWFFLTRLNDYLFIIGLFPSCNLLTVGKIRLFIYFSTVNLITLHTKTNYNIMSLLNCESSVSTHSSQDCAVAYPRWCHRLCQFINSIHSSIHQFSSTYPIQGCGGAGAYPRWCHRVGAALK